MTRDLGLQVSSEGAPCLVASYDKLWGFKISLTRIPTNLAEANKNRMRVLERGTELGDFRFHFLNSELINDQMIVYKIIMRY